MKHLMQRLSRSLPVMLVSMVVLAYTHYLDFQTGSAWESAADWNQRVKVVFCRV